MIHGTVLALSGGIGGAKLVLGLSHVLPPEQLVIVVNTGDDFEHLGLHISPDIDTQLYTLAGINNPDTGWGRAEETWSCMSTLETLGGETWFQLGDKDLAMNLYRTARLNDGASLSEVTEELRKRLQIGPQVLPMSDDSVRTKIETECGLLPFQEYLVRAQSKPKVTAVHYIGAGKSRAVDRFTDLLQNDSLHAIIICPSNPYVSIGPILAIPEVHMGIKNAQLPVIAVSPIVSGRALKGPLAKLMREFGVSASAAAVAEHYRGLIDGFVLDRQDGEQKKSIETTGIPCCVTNTVMHSLDDRIQLARDVLDFAHRLRSHHK
ncbi:2-phospho-L-lactate transferase [Tolypothrix sp. NIES-4075]|uniref:2-phospho-L-lactate transferase n=1 Tax=Tolypothrix sp. NIES-4075 TaxID=2005459 RepID=UPI000B5C3EF3|nr:2-phospho-L-lactate transferase [Tolypothrix sp. NIES-4075]GAX44321.1 2-phospho-L-lactate transferase [Tolypothrix sp. NIES-4075]